MAQKQRLNQCFAPRCNTGYSRIKQAQKLSFKAPADSGRRSVWERNLRRSDRRLTPDCAICELHFEKEYVHCQGLLYVHCQGLFIILTAQRCVLSAGAHPRTGRCSNDSTERCSMFK
ncbi:hypothetical protein HPB48_026757 [Haemaphysalis longicornis]|uniref:THAP-type domain-containing protein n=1 Tax=Haemaphysalis longicornis TaxID=44386 RepID=A0A9J6HD01_HAELO|nr:hypothetical protein HPB48_026757 [Haemaphysalis longicornis]